MKTEATHDPGTLERLFGATSAAARVLDFMNIFCEYDYNKKDIAENSNVTPQRITKVINKLVDLELIKKTRESGRSEMYKFNTENPAAKYLAQFAHELAAQEGQKIAARELAKEAQQPQAF